MDPFEYLSVLISVILALGMTRVVAGIGEMLQVRSRRSIYWVHAVWVANLFLFLVVTWWIFYRWRAESEWTYFLFVFVLLSPILLYLAAVVLFPAERNEHQSDERRGLRIRSQPDSLLELCEGRTRPFLCGRQLEQRDPNAAVLAGWRHVRFRLRGACRSGS
ncbi:MAG: hypothetical protein ABIR71_11450 [Chthoniobacterales bacterium]